VAVAPRGDGALNRATGTGAGGGPHVKVFEGVNTNALESFFWGDPTFLCGVFVG
jgi:hypothetical protein